MRSRIHMRRHGGFRTLCGINALPPYPTADWREWRTLPRQAQCGSCDRLHWQHKSATPEQVLAVEAALHGIARAFATATPGEDKQ